MWHVYKMKLDSNNENFNDVFNISMGKFLIIILSVSENLKMSMN